MLYVCLDTPHRFCDVFYDYDRCNIMLYFPIIVYTHWERHRQAHTIKHYYGSLILWHYNLFVVCVCVSVCVCVKSVRAWTCVRAPFCYRMRCTRHLSIQPGSVCAAHCLNPATAIRFSSCVLVVMTGAHWCAHFSHMRWTKEQSHLNTHQRCVIIWMHHKYVCS